MKRHYTMYIEDILRAMEAIEGYTQGMTEKAFLQDGKTQNAVAWNIMIIGEATKNVPPSIRQKYPEIPWREMARMRDKISHTYFGVSPEIVWAVVQKELPPLKPIIQRVLDELKGPKLFPGGKSQG